MIDGAELLKKLQFKAGTRLWLVNAPAEVAAALSSAGGILPVGAGEPCDSILVFASSPGDVEQVAGQVMAALPADGILWFAYRKGKAGKLSGLTRDTGWDVLARADWRPVRSISIDEDWTGLRFKPIDQVKSDRPDAWRTR